MWVKRMYFAPEIPSELTEVENPDRVKVGGEVVEGREGNDDKTETTLNNSTLPAKVTVKFPFDKGEENVMDIDTHQIKDGACEWQR